MHTERAVSNFRVTYSPELTQYVVERGEMRVVPTAIPSVDADAAKRAAELCQALNRVYGRADSTETP